MSHSIKIKFGILILYILWDCNIAHAQDIRLLSFEQAVTIALSQNPSLEAASEAIEASLHQKKAAAGLRFPSLQLSGGYTHMQKTIGIDFNALKAPARNLAQDLYPHLSDALRPIAHKFLNELMPKDWFYPIQERNWATISTEVLVPIWHGGAINAANRAATLQSKKATTQCRSQKNALISQLTERYFGVLLSEYVLRVRQQVVRGMQHHLDDATALEKNGMIASTQRLYAAVKLKEAERQATEAQLEAATLRKALATTLSTEERIMPITPLFVLDQLPDRNEHLQKVLTDNPQLEQIRLTASLQKEALKGKRSEFFPSVSAMGAASLYNDRVAAFVPRWAVGISVNFKLFNGLRREHQYAALKSDLRRVEHLEHQMQDDLCLLIERQFNQMQNALNTVVSIEKTLDFARAYLRQQELAFEEGMATMTDVIDAELNLASVRIERLKAAYQFDCLLSRLLETSGESQRFVTYTRSPQRRKISYLEHENN